MNGGVCQLMAFSVLLRTTRVVWRKPSIGGTNKTSESKEVQVPAFTLYIDRKTLNGLKSKQQRKLLELVKSAIGRAMIIRGTHPQHVYVGGCIVTAERSVNCVLYQVVISLTAGGPRGTAARGTHALVMEMALVIFRSLTKAGLPVVEWSVFCPVSNGGYFSASDFTQLELTQE